MLKIISHINCYQPEPLARTTRMNTYPRVCSHGKYKVSAILLESKSAQAISSVRPDLYYSVTILSILL
jgi:hypothetical protein